MTGLHTGLGSLYPAGAQPPQLDRRTPDDIYAACLAAARKKLPNWAVGFDDDPQYFDRADVGLVLFKLFGELFHKLNMPLNAVPIKYVLAFWDFIGISLRSPEAAAAPIAFTVTGSTAVPVPARTRVVARTVPGLVFETTDPLLVLPLRIAAAYGVQPDHDSYVDYSARIDGSGEAFDLFGVDGARMPFVHTICIDDPGFDFAGQSGALTIAIQGANLYPAYFQTWEDATGIALRPERTIAGYDTLSFKFADLPVLPKGSVGGVVGAWIRVAPAPGQRIVAFRKTALPQIQAITLTISLDSVAADLTMFNSTIVDMKKAGKPFGATPTKQDSFYIGSTAVFSRTRAEVTLSFDLQTIELTATPTLAWEYWEGNGWITLDVKDGTADLKKTGAITFICPRIEATAINDKINYWIRVRIAEGDYGRKAGILVTESAKDVIGNVLAPYVSDAKGAAAALADKGISFGFAYQPESYTPPFIKALRIACVSIKGPSRVMSVNGFEVAPLTRDPYQPPSERVPTFYLGLESPSYDTQVAQRPFTLFFASGRALLATKNPPIARLDHTTQSVMIEALTSVGWVALAGYQTMTTSDQSGISTFEAPIDFPEFKLFGTSFRWLRCRARPGSRSDAKTRSIHVNVVAAMNAMLHEDAILGSSTGAPSQTFAFPQKPVLADPILQVLEPMPATFAEEAEASSTVRSSQLLQSDGLTEAWLTWTEQQNFDFSIPASRHYVLNHETGQVRFGDGLRGRIPPEGRDNIKASRYRRRWPTADGRGTLSSTWRTAAAWSGALPPDPMPSTEPWATTSSPR